MQNMSRMMLLFVMLTLIVNVNCETPLDHYVYQRDSTFSYKLLQTYPSPTHTVYILNFTSQTWLNASFSSRPIWWHYVIITVPQVLKHPDVGFLLISGGSNNDPVPTESSTTEIALQSGTIAVEIQQVPNQPIEFMADPTHMARYEDDILAWIWRVYIETKGNDPFILPYLPMTKAAFSAIEVTLLFLRKQEIQPPLGFVVAGVSKRGWIALTTAAAAAVSGSRVIGAIPIVADMINLQSHWKNHYRSLAGWTFALNSYYVQNVTKYLDDVYFQLMGVIIDPFTYFYRFHNNIKILQFQAADDQYFQPDSEDYFWNDLQFNTGGSYLRRIPNSGHSISGYQDSLASFYLSICDNSTLPKWIWTRIVNETHGQIVANVSVADGHPTPINVTVFQARTVNGTKRDFRLVKLDPITKQVVSNPVVWVEMNGTEISHIGQSSIIYKYVTPLPPAGFWDGIFMQVIFPGPENTTLTLTTETLIIPNTYPIEPCSGEECYGTLV